MCNSLRELCYNVPDQSIYGELTDGSIAKLVSYVKQFSSVTILDIGSGSGATLCAFAKHMPKTSCDLVGVEISQIRATISRQIIPHYLPPNAKKWLIIEDNVLTWSALPPCNISFSFDTTFTKALMTHIVTLQLNCPELQFVISSKGSRYYDTSLWSIITTVPCKLKGSGQTISFHVRIKKKTLKH